MADFTLGESPPKRRSEREAALDRLRAIRETEGGRSNRMKRLQVALVCVCLGVGSLQGWFWLQLLAIPAALACWWLDDGVAQAEERFARLYDRVQSGATSPPLMGEEADAAQALPPPDESSTPLLRVPGAGFHALMLAISIGFNLFL